MHITEADFSQKNHWLDFDPFLLGPRLVLLGTTHYDGKMLRICPLFDIAISDAFTHSSLTGVLQ